MDGLMYVVAPKLARQVQIMAADIVLFKTYLLILAFPFKSTLLWQFDTNNYKIQTLRTLYHATNTNT